MSSKYAQYAPYAPYVESSSNSTYNTCNNDIRHSQFGSQFDLDDIRHSQFGSQFGSQFDLDDIRHSQFGSQFGSQFDLDDRRHSHIDRDGEHGGHGGHCGHCGHSHCGHCGHCRHCGHCKHDGDHNDQDHYGDHGEHDRDNDISYDRGQDKGHISSSGCNHDKDCATSKYCEGAYVNVSDSLIGEYSVPGSCTDCSELTLADMHKKTLASPTGDVGYANSCSHQFIANRGSCHRGDILSYNKVCAQVQPGRDSYAQVYYNDCIDSQNRGYNADGC
jgi:hypothetical protein